MTGLCEINQFCGVFLSGDIEAGFLWKLVLNSVPGSMIGPTIAPWPAIWWIEGKDCVPAVPVLKLTM